jgi:hypothetical protein
VTMLPMREVYIGSIPKTEKAYGLPQTVTVTTIKQPLLYTH